jgi:hypothetical protein
MLSVLIAIGTVWLVAAVNIFTVLHHPNPVFFAYFLVGMLFGGLCVPAYFFALDTVWHPWPCVAGTLIAIGLLVAAHVAQRRAFSQRARLAARWTVIVFFAGIGLLGSIGLLLWT